MTDAVLRSVLVALLRGGDAHSPVESVIREFPVSLAQSRTGALPHTPWRLLEHMRIAQWDILEFSRNADHVSPEFPGGYWPSGDSPPTSRAWDESVAAFCSDLQAMQRLVEDPGSDLLAPIPHGDGQTLLREALLVADHNSYHLGQLVAIRRALETPCI
jgi:hypothetical protein